MRPGWQLETLLSSESPDGVDAGGLGHVVLRHDVAICARGHWHCLLGLHSWQCCTCVRLAVTCTHG